MKTYSTVKWRFLEGFPIQMNWKINKKAKKFQENFFTKGPGKMKTYSTVKWRFLEGFPIQMNWKIYEKGKKISKKFFALHPKNENSIAPGKRKFLSGFFCDSHLITSKPCVKIEFYKGSEEKKLSEFYLVIVTKKSP